MCGEESSISFSLCGSQEFSLQIFPDDSLCVDAGDAALNKLEKGHPVEWGRQRLHWSHECYKSEQSKPLLCVTKGPNFAEVLGGGGWGNQGQEIPL